MSIHQIGFEGGLRGPVRSHERYDRLASQPGSGEQNELVQNASVGRDGTVQVSQEFQRLTALHDRIRAVAATVRTMDQALAAAGTTVDAMKREVEVMVKNYPPFPPGSEERERRLRSYAALRAMIERLTIPPEQAAPEPAGQTREAENAIADEWTYLVESNGMTRTVRTEDVPKGPTGLHLPELSPPEAVDARALAEALQRLEEVSVGLLARRERLREHTFGIPGSHYDKGITDEGAEEQSVEVRRSVAARHTALAVGSTLQLEQLMG